MNDSIEHELISAYLDGELTPAEREQVERMLAESAAARELCDDLRSLRAELLALPRQRVGVDFAARVAAAIEAETAANRNGTPQPQASSKTETPTKPPLASPRRDLPPGGGLSWAAVAALLGTLAAGIVAILTLPMPWNQVAGPNIPNVPTLPAPAAAKQVVRKNVEQPLAAAPSEPPPMAAPAGPDDGVQNGQFLARQNARDVKAAAGAAPAEFANAEAQKQREKTDQLQDKLAGPSGRPAIAAAPGKPAFAEKPGKSLPESEEDRARRANRSAGAADSRPLRPMTGDVAGDPQDPSKAKVETAKAEGAERKELYAAAAAPDGGGEDELLRRAIEKQGIVWTQGALRGRDADRNEAFDFARGGRPADEALDKVRADRAPSKDDAARYYVVEAPEANVEQLIADLRKQGIDVQIASADGLLPSTVAQRDARRKLNQPEAGFGGGRGFAPSPALPLPAALPPGPAAPAAEAPARAIPAPAPPAALAQPMPFRAAGGPAPGAAPAAFPAPGEDAAAGEGAPSRAAKRGEELLPAGPLPNAVLPPVNLKKAEQPSPSKNAVGYAWRADPRDAAVESERAKVPHLAETDLAPEAAAEAATAKAVEEKPVEEKPVEEKPVEEKPAEKKPADNFADGKPGQGNVEQTRGPMEPRVRVLLILRRAAVLPAADPAK